MKEKIFYRSIKFIYLVCCLLIIFTPSDIIPEKSKTLKNTSGNIKEATVEEREKYSNKLNLLSEKVKEEHEGITSLLIMKDGKMYYEKYYNGNNENTLFEVQSCTKTIIAILTGIAIDNGFIEDENANYLSMFDNLKCPKITDGFEKIKIKDMLTMSSGINWDKYCDSLFVKMQTISKGVDYGLNLIPSADILYEPGEKFYYNSNESRSLMALVAFNSKMEDIDFLEKYLFSKLDISDFYWPYNDSGMLPGGKDLYLCSRDLAKIGQLLIDDGEYGGEQIVSKEWVEKMLSVSLRDVDCMDIKPADKIDYGYYLWHVEYDEQDVYFAYGRGGQYIFMIPDMNICVVTSAIDKIRNDNFREIAFDVIDIFKGDF